MLAPVRLLLQLVAIGFAGLLLGRCGVGLNPRIRAVKMEAAELGPKPRPAASPNASAGSGALTSQDVPDGQATPDSASVILDRMMNSIGDPDSFKRAERLLPLLDHMTAEDFRAITPEQFAALADSAVLDNGLQDQDFIAAFSDEYVRRWLQFDREGAVDSLLSRKHDYVSTGLWRVCPEAVLERYVANTPESKSIPDIDAAFESLAKRNGALARRFLNQIPDPDRRKELNIKVECGLAASDPMTAVMRARELGSRHIFDAALAAAKEMGSGVVRQVLELNAGKFRPNDSTFAYRYPDVNWESFWPELNSSMHLVDAHIFRSALQMDAAERVQLIERLQSSSSTISEEAIAEAVSAWAVTDPRAAADWSMARAKLDTPSADANRALQQAIRFWLVSDKDAALQWLANLPDSKLEHCLKIQMAEAFAGKIDFARIKELIPTQVELADREQIDTIASAYSERDPARTADWVMSLSPEGARLAAEGVIMRWTSRDPESAAQWLDRQPSGVRRDQFAAAFVDAVAQLDVETAEGWIETIETPRYRRLAIHRVFETMRKQDEAGALAWLHFWPDFNDRQRAALVRNFR
jgi:hypothetical protein